MVRSALVFVALCALLCAFAAGQLHVAAGGNAPPPPQGTAGASPAPLGTRTVGMSPNCRSALAEKCTSCQRGPGWFMCIRMCVKNEASLKDVCPFFLSAQWNATQMAHDRWNSTCKGLIHNNCPTCTRGPGFRTCVETCLAGNAELQLKCPLPSAGTTGCKGLIETTCVTCKEGPGFAACIQQCVNNDPALKTQCPLPAVHFTRPSGLLPGGFPGAHAVVGGGSSGTPPSRPLVDHDHGRARRRRLLRTTV